MFFLRLARITWVSHNRIDKQVKYFAFFVEVQSDVMHLLSLCCIIGLLLTLIGFCCPIFFSFPLSSSLLDSPSAVIEPSPSQRHLAISHWRWDRVFASLYKVSLDSPSLARLLMSHWEHPLRFLVCIDFHSPPARLDVPV